MKNLIHAFLEECDYLIHSVSALTVLVAGVLFYSILYPMPYRQQVPQKLPVLVVDQDRSTTSRTLLRMVDSTEGARVAAVFTDAPPAMRALQEGRGQAVLIIPRDLERNVLRGTPSVLPLYLDAGYLLPYRVTFKGIRIAVEMMGAGVRMEQFQAMGIPPLPAQAMQLRGQMSVNTLYNPAGNYALSTIPPVFVLILQQTLLIGSAILAGARLTRPRDLGLSSFRPDILSPFYLLGRLPFLACLYLIHALYYMWFLPVFYDLPRVAATWDMLLFLLPFFFAVAAAGTAFARLYVKPEHVLVAALPCSIPFLFLSGFAWPHEAMPVLLRSFAQLLPSTPAITGYMLMSDRGTRLAEILPLWYHLWGLALLYFGLAWGVAKVPRRSEAARPSEPEAEVQTLPLS